MKVGVSDTEYATQKYLHTKEETTDNLLNYSSISFIPITMIVTFFIHQEEQKYFSLFLHDMKHGETYLYEF